MITLLYILGALLAAIVVWAIAAPNHRPKLRLSPDHIEDFFRNPANFAGVPIERIFDAVGPSSDYSSMDFGVSLYHWQTSRRRIRLITQGDYPSCIQMRDLGDDAELETIWENRNAGP